MEQQNVRPEAPLVERINQAQNVVAQALEYARDEGPNPLNYGDQGYEGEHKWAQGPGFTAAMQLHQEVGFGFSRASREAADGLFSAVGVDSQREHIAASGRREPNGPTVDGSSYTRRLQLAIDTASYAHEVGYDPQVSTPDELVDVVHGAVQARDELQADRESPSDERERLALSRELVAQSAANAYSGREGVDSTRAAELRAAAGMQENAPSQQETRKNMPPRPGQFGAPVGAVALTLDGGAYRMGNGQLVRARR